MNAIGYSHDRYVAIRPHLRTHTLPMRAQRANVDRMEGLDANTPILGLVLVVLTALGLRLRPGVNGPAALRAIAESMESNATGGLEPRHGSPGARVLDAVADRLRADLRKEIHKSLEPLRKEVDAMQRRDREHSMRLRELELAVATRKGYDTGRHATIPQQQDLIGR